MIRSALCAVLLLPAAANAVGVETLGASGAANFERAPLSVAEALAASARPQEPILQPALKPVALVGPRLLGGVLATVDLAAQLDKHLHLMGGRFGARAMDLGAATDAGFKNFYLTFTDASGTVLGALGDLNRLRGDGVNIRIDGATVYNFKVSISIFSPVRGSTLQMSPVQGTSGASASVKTGAILDAAQARSTRMNLGGMEHWIFYGRDAAPGGGGFAATRSFLFVKMDGLSSKAWPLAEGALTVGVPAVVDLGGNKVVVTRTAEGRLVVNSAN